MRVHRTAGAFIFQLLINDGNHMWKWIGGCLLLVIVCLMAAAWWGFHKVTSSFSPDGSIRVAMPGTPAHVFSALSDGDSIAGWMSARNTQITVKSGPLAVGDSVKVEVSSIRGLADRPIVWKITEIVPDKIVTREIESRDRKAKLTVTSRDSIAQSGDSTIVISRVSSVGSATGANEQMALTMFKVQSKVELEALKAWLGGKRLGATRRF